jgi:hypothetical protein
MHARIIVPPDDAVLGLVKKACVHHTTPAINLAATKSNREIKRDKNEHTSQLIAQLKQECPRPEVVEVWDIRARDPKLLVFLKAYRNTVAVPRHWSQKRKYLQGKRGIEKPPFELPSYIQETGAPS